MTADMFAAPGAGSETPVHKFPLPPETREFRPSYSRGQYVLPAVTGVGTPEYDPNATDYFTRVTTGAKTLEDTTGLEGWKLRSVVEGLSMNPTLLQGVDRHSDDLRKILDEIAEQAHVLNGGVRASEWGTCIHAWCEAVELGAVEWGAVPDQVAPYAEAYFRKLAQFEITCPPDPSGRAYVERIVYNPDTNWVGTFDNLFQLADGTWVIGDKKTAKDSSIAYAWLAIAIQLWNYAEAAYILSVDGTHWETMPPVRKDLAVVAHIPSDSATPRCDMVSIDLTAGRVAADMAARVRDMRTQAKSVIPNTIPIPRSRPAESVNETAVQTALRNLISTIHTHEEMAKVYEAYSHAWTDELTEYANKVLAEKGIQ